MAPIWQLLKSSRNDEKWNPKLRGGLRSLLAYRQFPQSRVFAAGWSEHNRCILCLHGIVQRDTGGRAPTGTGSVDVPAANAALDGSEPNDKDDLRRKPVVANADQIERAPVGNLQYRSWKCGHNARAEARGKWPG